DRGKVVRRVFIEWLREHGQSEGSIERFWRPVVVSACNLDVERVSAASALHVFQDGFLRNRDAAVMGVSRVPLLELYDAAEEAIARVGGELRLGTSVESLDERSVTLSTGETLRGSRVICALPFERAAKAIDASVRRRDRRIAALDRLEHSPILGVHLMFDRPVLHVPHAVLVERPTQWVFRKDEHGRKVHAVVSAADEWMGLSEREIVDRIVEDMEACLPRARGAEIEHARAVKEKRATFAPTPEAEVIRPGVEGGSGLLLAGDYVQAGWPATMEGAARSGYLAAAAALGRDAAWALRPELPASLMCRALDRLAV
ncbi:MAG: FAD-dependent oxidoreductase, partial [Planctomycetota bacterium]|nr:FAD-dependent oxidoreductase [Planctomycetota bacterium]